MHLKSLTLKGFKSFASATTLKFEPGICAVVGPNGSGKSNVVDALAWVMGEQGAKTLRGGKMDDVIFAGAGERKALGRAEVTLTIDNSDGALPIDFTEVSVTRRMFRDGASEYEINGTKARLMDIQELLSDSGIGREMHVIVGQGRLAQILESRPEERRSYIEEAAGVLKHRRRREKAQRKLISMQGNLDRLHDLTEELAKQLKPLARQAEAAQRAEQVQATIRNNRLLLTTDRVRSLTNDVRELDADLAILSADSGCVRTELEDSSAELVLIEDEQVILSDRVDAAQALWFRLSTIAEKNSATLRIAADRAADTGVADTWTGADPDELTARAEAAEHEQAILNEELEIAAASLEQARDEVEERAEAARHAEHEYLAQTRAIADHREGIVRLVAQQDAVEQRRLALDAELERLEQAVVEQREVIEDTTGAESAEALEALNSVESAGSGLAEMTLRAAEESAGADARVAELRDQERALERAIATLDAQIEGWEDRLRPTDGGKVAIAAAKRLGHEELRPLASVVTVKGGWATAVAAVLPESLVGAGHHDAVAALVTALVEAEQGRITLLHSTVGDATASAGMQSWRLDSSALRERGESSASWLLDHLDIAPEVLGPVTALLVDVVAVDSVDTGRAVVAADPRLRAVTPRGIVLGTGWIAAGSGGTTPVELTSTITDAMAKREEHESELADLQALIRGAEQSAEELRTALASAKAATREHESRLMAARRRAEASSRAAEQAGRLLARALASRDDAEQRREKLATEADEIGERLSAVEATSGRGSIDDLSTASRDNTAQALIQARAVEVEARLALRTAEERAGNHRGRADGLRRQARQEEAAREQFVQAMARRRQTRERATVVHAQALRVDMRIRDALGRAEELRTESIDAHRRGQETLVQVKEKVSSLTLRMTRLTEKSHQVEIARSQAQLRIEQALDQAMEQLGMTAAQLLAEAPGEDFDRDIAAQELASAEKSLRSLGKVNPLALEEYAALEERHRFLATQLDDVEKARIDLEDVIKDVDRTILQLFSDAWADVEAEFPKVFNTLFPGGAGRLILTDPADMLTTGIEVEARPPGKKVKRLSLLSGGEKSLTALALLVAIFRARPSPFYVMDEVEAALDDVNLRRLIALFLELRRDSQLIVITHQKPTMDIANVLYGVTMHGDGVTRVISQRMHPVEAGTPRVQS